MYHSGGECVVNGRDYSHVNRLRPFGNSLYLPLNSDVTLKLFFKNFVFKLEYST